jgi:hypothetical protein
VQADGQHARQGEQPEEKGEKLGKKGSARGRAARPLTLGDFLPGGRLVGHQQRDPVDKPCVGQRVSVSSPSHGPVLTEASLGPFSVEKVGLAGRVSDRAMRHFRQRARRRSRAWRDTICPALEQPIGGLEALAGKKTVSASKSSPETNSGDNHVNQCCGADGGYCP